MRSPMSGKLVRPIGMAPAPRMRSTTGASLGETASASAGTEFVVGVSARSMFSFTVNGTPWSGPNRSPALTAASARSAAARASVSSRRTTALSRGLTSSMRARCASTTSRLDTSRLAIIDANSAAFFFQSSITRPPRREG